MSMPPQDPSMQDPMQQSPITMDMIMKLRNDARGQTDMQGAAARRLGQSSENGPLLDGKTPDEMVVDDMQEQMDSEIEPPDIDEGAAKTMMKYGAIQQYLDQARGMMPNGQ